MFFLGVTPVPRKVEAGLRLPAVFREVFHILCSTLYQIVPDK